MLIVFFTFVLEGLLCYLCMVPTMDATVNLVVSNVLLGVNTVVMLAYISKRYEKHDKTILYALYMSLFLKVLLLLWDYYATSIYILPNSHADSESFHWGGVSFAQGATGVENYAYVVGAIYSLFGIQRITAQSFNILLSFAGIDLFDHILNELHIEGLPRRWSLLLSAVLPNYLIMSAILIRECIISVILCAALYLFVRWWSSGNPVLFALSFVTSLGACWFHSGSIAFAIGISLVLILTRRQETGGRKLEVSLQGIVLAALALNLFIFLFNHFDDSLLSSFQGLDVDKIDSFIDEHGFYSKNSGDDSSHYSAGIEGLVGIVGLVVNTPIRIVYFLWVPMPWSVRGLSDVLSFLGSSLFYGGSVFASIWHLWTKRIDARWGSLFVSVLAIALCGAFIFAWGTESAGTAIRHREKFYYIYLLLAAALISARNASDVKELSAMVPSISSSPRAGSTNAHEPEVMTLWLSPDTDKGSLSQRDGGEDLWFSDASSGTSRNELSRGLYA